jgi:methionine biosynthesis protein MetW
VDESRKMKKFEVIGKWIKHGSKVLVLGCGEGELINYLQKKSDARVFGLDIDEKKVFEAISKGLSVIQGDINCDLDDYSEKSFDHIIAHDIIQIMDKPDEIIRKLLKLSDNVIISFPNFAYIKIRLGVLFSGRMPKTSVLPYEWYDTPNIHLFTIRDFKVFCRNENIKITGEHYTGIGKKTIPVCMIPNLLAEFSYFRLTG